MALANRSSAPAHAAVTLDAERAAAQIELAQLEARVRPAKLDKVLDIASLFSPLLLLLLWEAISRLGWIDARFFPPPSGIAHQMIDDFRSGELLDHIGATLSRVAVGYVMGGVPALLLGMTMGLFKRPRQILSPIFHTLYTVPKIAILPLILFIFGIGEMSKYVVIAIGAFFLILFNTLTGVLQIPSIYFDVAKNAGASRLQVYRTVALPAALPSIFTGLKLAAGTSYVLIAASEFVGAKTGVGYYIWSSWQLFSVPKMFVGIVVISAMGYLTITAIEGLQRVLIPYAGRGYR